MPEAFDPIQNSNISISRVVYFTNEAFDHIQNPHISISRVFYFALLYVICFFLLYATSSSPVPTTACNPLIESNLCC